METLRVISVHARSFSASIASFSDLSRETQNMCGLSSVLVRRQIPVHKTFMVGD